MIDLDIRSRKRRKTKQVSAARDITGIHNLFHEVKKHFSL
jgi:hypothetical protein